MTGATSQYHKAILAVAAILVVVVRHLLRRRAAARAEGAAEALARTERLTTGVLLVLAVLGVGNYFGFSTKPLVGRTAFSGYDLIHYYLNAKYFPELGYVHLYEAVIVADGETKDRFRKWGFGTVRDLDTSIVIPIGRVRANAEQTKALCTPRRWKQFKRDFRFLQRTMSRRSQRDLLNDHGYNGPPLLQTFAGWIANRVEVRDVKWLCHLETVLILLLFFAVYRTYGLRVTAIAVLWYSVDFSARWPGIGYGIFRIDWCIALVLACLLLKDADPPEGEPLGRRRVARLVGAGLLVAYSAMMKIFPAAWLFGLGVRALWLLGTKRRLDRVAAIVIGSFLIGSTVLGTVAYSAIGKRNVDEFIEDIQEHLQPMNLSSQRMGFGVAIAYRGELRRFESGPARTARFMHVGELAPIRYALALLALFLLGLTIRPSTSENVPARTSAADATEVGFIPFYFLMIASHYYWIHRLTVVLHHSRRDGDEVEHTVALSALFGIEAITNSLDQYTHFRYGVVGTTSVALGVYCSWVIGSRLWRVLRQRPASTVPLLVEPNPSPSA